MIARLGDIHGFHHMKNMLFPIFVSRELIELHRKSNTHLRSSNNSSGFGEPMEWMNVESTHSD